MEQVADMNMYNANYIKEKLSQGRTCTPMFKGAIFNEFVVSLKEEPDMVNAELLKKNIYGGLNLKTFYPELGNALLVCATETKTKEDLDRFVTELALVSTHHAAEVHRAGR
jgi:glycine dehydrogenase subunit 1